jgi:hypothetical protein
MAWLVSLVGHENWKFVYAEFAISGYITTM